MARGSSKNFWILLLMTVIGLLIGGFLGELLGKYIPMLKFGINAGVTPHTWDFIILKLTFGLSFNINMFSVIGIIAAIIIFRNM